MVIRFVLKKEMITVVQLIRKYVSCSNDKTVVRHYLLVFEEDRA